LKIPVCHGHLEAVVREPRGLIRGAAVVCHPHPLQGGTMHTKAVYRVAQAMAEIDIVALRFNFRGVGRSTGTYDAGVGEREDTKSALDWLEERYPKVTLMAGGFSFGSMVALRVGLTDPRVKALFGFGVPVRLYDYSFLADTAKPTLLVQGSQDEFGTALELQKAVASFGPEVSVATVEGADHYFSGAVDGLKKSVAKYFTKGPGGDIL
jgi:alpha/beta superfamily hydrolase